jgi:hypothetical protein
MTIQTHFIKEPLLEFGNGQQLEHPQDGLFLYGPVSAGGNPEVIHVGVAGTPEGIVDGVESFGPPTFGCPKGRRRPICKGRPRCFPKMLMQRKSIYSLGISIIS